MGMQRTIARNLVAASLALGACEGTADTEAMTSSPGAGGKADDTNAAAAIGLAVTASSVEALEGEVSSVAPEVDEFVVGDVLPVDAYLGPMGLLGHYGFLGAYGPIGTLGPVGTNVWNPSAFIALGGPWEKLAVDLAGVGGPLSADGPLSERGPLNRERWRDALNAQELLAPAFIDQLEPGGLLVPLGPIGPLGALGPLGPLGPVGAHGYVANDAGEWIPGDDETRCVHSDEKDVCRTVEVPWSDSEKRSYGLFENYEESFAQTMDDNDTSFMVIGSIDDDELDSYAFTSADRQIVTVAVVGQWTLYDPATAMGLLGQAALSGYALPTFVPNFIFPFSVYNHGRSFDDFDLALSIEDGKQRIERVSETGGRIDWISVAVPAGAKLSVEVSLHSRWSAPWRVFGPEYRLIVVGSTPQLSGIRVSGDHQVRD